jgi:hypothetical protein
MRLHQRQRGRSWAIRIVTVVVVAGLCGLHYAHRWEAPSESALDNNREIWTPISRENRNILDHPYSDQKKPFHQVASSSSHSGDLHHPFTDGSSLPPSASPRSAVRPVTNDPLEEARWDNRYFQQSLNRHKVMLRESGEELRDARERLDRVVSDPQKVAVDLRAPREVPCYCHEMSSMAPGGSWCDNHKPRLSGSHVCILRNVCMAGGRAHVLSEKEPPPDKQRPPGTVIPTGGRQMDIAGTQHDLRIVFKPANVTDQTFKQGAEPTYGFFKDAPVVTGTTVFYASKFPQHITHVLEGAGSLQLAISRMQTDRCNASDPTCFGPVQRLVFFGGSVPRESWHENMLRVMLGDVEKLVSFLTPGDFSSPQCFEKVIVPGFYYSVFPDTESTEPFQKTARKYLERNANVSFSDIPRRILLAKRSTKRIVTDWPVLVDFVKELVSELNKRNAGRNSIIVDEIEFGSHNFEQQASAVATADILLGLHGADLTNMMFMRRGSVLIEMNPLFFFENRFFEIATNLGLHYMAWTCTHEDCAFGGDKAQFHNAVNQFGYDHQKRVFKRNGREFHYPFDRYLGYACKECEEANIGGMTNRETNVKIAESLGEIKLVVMRAFSTLGWV